MCDLLIATLVLFPLCLFVTLTCCVTSNMSALGRDLIGSLECLSQSGISTKNTQQQHSRVLIFAVSYQFIWLSPHLQPLISFSIHSCDSCRGTTMQGAI